MVVFLVFVAQAVEAPDVVGALAFVGGVHRIPHFGEETAFGAVVRVGEGVVFLIMESTAYPASLLLFASVGEVIKTPTVTTLGDRRAVLECSDRAMSSISGKESLFEDLFG